LNRNQEKSPIINRKKITVINQYKKPFCVSQPVQELRNPTPIESSLTDLKVIESTRISNSKIVLDDIENISIEKKSKISNNNKQLITSFFSKYEYKGKK